MKLILEGQLVLEDSLSTYTAMPGEHLLINTDENAYIGESLKVLSGPHVEYLARDVYTIELQDVPTTCPFINFTPRTGHGVLQYVTVHIQSNSQKS